MTTESQPVYTQGEVTTTGSHPVYYTGCPCTTRDARVHPRAGNASLISLSDMRPGWSLGDLGLHWEQEKSERFEQGGNTNGKGILEDRGLGGAEFQAALIPER